jgi:hypothetical protein
MASDSFPFAVLPGVGVHFMSIKMDPFPEKCLTGAVDNFARVTSIDESLQGEAFQDNILRSVSH